MHSFRKPAVMIIIIVCMLFSVIEAFAASGESIEVCIPVTNHGHAGMVGLFDSTGEKLLGESLFDYISKFVIVFVILHVPLPFRSSTSYCSIFYYGYLCL